jgi:UDP-N-acetyl-D-mannosaminuronic acid transferase (WecB/TagA/CpsF family)
MSPTEQILGVRFWNGSSGEAVQAMCEHGGLLVVPAAPALVNIQYDEGYRDALVRSDIAIADSGLMVMLWKLIQRRTINRVSGLAYLKHLLDRPELRERGAMVLVLPTERAREKALSYLRARGFNIEPDECYIAPVYAEGRAPSRPAERTAQRPSLRDPALLELLNARRPAHIIIAIGGGVQEKLGLYLRDALAYRPAIHCIGAALGFLTGDQKPIPDWADKLYLGWLLRLARNPKLYARRFSVARKLPGLIARYGSELPVMEMKSGK